MSDKWILTDPVVVGTIATVTGVVIGFIGLFKKAGNTNKQKSQGNQSPNIIGNSNNINFGDDSK